MAYKIWYNYRGFDKYKIINADTYEKALKKARLGASVVAVEIIEPKNTTQAVIDAMLRDF